MDDNERHLQTKRDNYRATHAGTAKHKGVSVEFRLAKTLTEMRKVLWGIKKKNKKKQSYQRADTLSDSND